MDRIPYRTPPRWWSPLLRPRFIRLLKRFRIRRVRRRERLVQVDVRGLEHLRSELAQNHGVMIVSKHVGHVDAYIFLAAGDALGVPFYYMAGWQVFALLRPLERLVLRMHGCFSVDREANDLRAFRQAVEILQHRRHPFVMFPEGELYHHNDVIYPFRPGAAAIALSAAKRSPGRISCVPAAIRYFYAEDPIPELLRLMDALEGHFRWSPRRRQPLGERVMRLAEAWIALREVQYLGRPQMGALPERIRYLLDVILCRVEERQGIKPAPRATVADRVMPLRQDAIKRRESAPADSPDAAHAEQDLEDVFVATQLYSYAHDCDAQRVSTERLAEILDKFEEDVLARPTATLRADRRAVIAFGPPIMVQPGRRRREEAQDLTEKLQRAVGDVLAGIPAPPATHVLPLAAAARVRATARSVSTKERPGPSHS